MIQFILKRSSLVLLVLLLAGNAIFAQKKAIYHRGWIDFNKNGVKDIFEDPSQTIDKRINDLLSQMTIDEKTGQCATLYGYKRVLKDELPTPGWKNEIWKDGIANIDEHLNGYKATQYSFPFSKHAEAINTVQHWFVEETRLGIPVDFTNEGIHGLNHDRATPLPSPIAIGSTWNPALVRQAGAIVGREAKALGYTNVYAPILDLARDPRWGRVVECEIDLLPFGARLITYMQVTRFLADYLNGDTYYKINNPMHNLQRSKAQFALLQSIENHYSEMQKYISEII